MSTSFRKAKRIPHLTTSTLQARNWRRAFLIPCHHNGSGQLCVIWVNDQKVQKPIYYFSNMLRDVETGYSKPEKNIFALIVSVQHLRLYFQANLIIVLTNQPLKTILH